MALAALGAFALSPSALSAPSARERATPAATLTTAALLRPEASDPARERFFPGGAPRPRPRQRPGRRTYPVARVVGSLRLRTRPAGPVSVRVPSSTEFGSPRVLGVARRRGHWLGVVLIMGAVIGWFGV